MTTPQPQLPSTLRELREWFHRGGLEAGDVRRLLRMRVAVLRRLWTELLGPRSSPPAQKFVLTREIAWRHQVEESGDLDATTRRLLKAAMRDAVAARKTRPTSGAGSPRPQSPPVRPRRAAVTATLPTASRLVRTWRGRTHEVEVLDGGKAFRYKGQQYKSLSEIARVITGSRWSGPRFFGLADRRKDPNPHTP
jgi:hypothetical protein